MQYRNDPTALRRAAQLPVGLEANDADALGKRSVASLRFKCSESAYAELSKFSTHAD